MCIVRRYDSPLRDHAMETIQADSSQGCRLVRSVETADRTHGTIVLVPRISSIDGPIVRCWLAAVLCCCSYIVVDIDFSPDERFVIYSSWSDCVHLVNVGGEFELHEALDFSPRGQACMFGVRFSPSSGEILAGLNHGVLMLVRPVTCCLRPFHTAAQMSDRCRIRW